MYGGVRPAIYRDTVNTIANNYAYGSTSIDVMGVNNRYGINDGNLALLAHVSPGVFGPQNSAGPSSIPLFNQWGWTPIG